MFKKRMSVIVLVIFALVLVGCGDNGFVKPAFDAGTISKTTYDMAMSTMGDLYKTGYVTEAQKEQAILYGKAYQLAHNGMIEALAVYQEKGGDANKSAYFEAAAQAGSELAKVLNYVNQFIIKKEVK